MKGLTDALSRLYQMEGAARKALEGAVKQSGQEALQAARIAAPVCTGRLRDSIRLQSQVRIARLKTDCPYAGAVEWGTLRTPAQPFLIPAARQSDYFERAKTALMEIIK